MATRTVTARNDAASSENKIHDDLVARRYGFKGGLVPGVTVYAYVTRPIVDELGPEWLDRGTVTFRLPAPLYEGEHATSTATPDADGVTAEVTSSGGTTCMTATASLPRSATAPFDVERGGPLPEIRPEASEASLAPGTVLAPITQDVDARQLAEYLHFVDDDLAFYRDEAIAHPGWLSRHCNRVLSANVLLGPWIHVGTTIHHHGPLHHGETLDVRGVVVDNVERKGHHFVDLDIAMSAGDRPVASARHTAIWRPRAGT